MWKDSIWRMTSITPNHFVIHNVGLVGRIVAFPFSFEWLSQKGDTPKLSLGKSAARSEQKCAVFFASWFPQKLVANRFFLLIHRSWGLTYWKTETLQPWSSELQMVELCNLNKSPGPWLKYVSNENTRKICENNPSWNQTNKCQWELPLRIVLNCKMFRGFNWYITLVLGQQKKCKTIESTTSRDSTHTHTHVALYLLSKIPFNVIPKQKWYVQENVLICSTFWHLTVNGIYLSPVETYVCQIICFNLPQIFK